VAVPARELEREFDWQREFILSRLPTTPSPEELKDLTDFMHGAPAPLERCSKCGLTRRAEGDPEDAGSYEEDPNDPDVMAQVYPRYVQAFRNKESGYRPLLRANADVIELGPHLGGFFKRPRSGTGGRPGSTSASIQPPSCGATASLSATDCSKTLGCAVGVLTLYLSGIASSNFSTQQKR
jgi:hypothetical protein